MQLKKVFVLLLVAIAIVLAKNIRCPGNLSTEDFVENLLDSTKFFKCTSEGRLQPLKCDDGLEFNVKLKVCQHTQEIQAVRWANMICNENRNGHIMANYSNDCLSFLLCDNGTVRESSCGSGYKFNPLVNYCDFEDNVVCNCVGTHCPSIGMTLPIEQINTSCTCRTTTACPCSTTTACPCSTTTACPCSTTTVCPCSTTSACPCQTTTPIYTTPACTTPASTTSGYSTPGHTQDGPICIFTTPPPEEDECVEGLPDERPEIHNTTPPPDTDVCAEGNPDEPEWVYCPPGTRC